MDQEKVSHVNGVTLCFRDSDKERQYQEDPDIGKEIDTLENMLLAGGNTLNKQQTRQTSN